MFCHTAARSKKSYVRALFAIESSAVGVSTSTAASALSTRPLVEPSTWFASRSTVIASAASPSIVWIRSTTDGSLLSNMRSSRLRDSASIGNASIASNAEVSRRP